MALSFSYRGRLVIVLDEENIERIQQADPFDFDGRKVPTVLTLAMPLQITVAYATKAELDKIVAMQQHPDLLMEYLSRGFKVTETDGQRRDPYKAL
jgi:hypothetical protein